MKNIFTIWKPKTSSTKWSLFWGYDTEHTKCPISTTHGFYAKFSIKTSVLDAVKNPGLSSLLWLTITKIIGPLGHRIWSGKNQKVEKTWKNGPNWRPQYCDNHSFITIVTILFASWTVSLPRSPPYDLLSRSQLSQGVVQASRVSNWFFIQTWQKTRKKGKNSFFPI